MEDLAAFSLSETDSLWQNNLTNPLWNRIASLDSDSGLTGVLNAIRLTANQSSYGSRLKSTLEAEAGHNPSSKSDSNSQLEQFPDKLEALSRSVSETVLNNPGLLRQPAVFGLTAAGKPNHEVRATNTDSLTGTAEGAPLVGAQAINTKINFQPNDAFVPKGYIKDTGKSYSATRGFGWVKQGTHTSLDVTANTRNRNQPGADQQLHTLIHMQYPKNLSNPTPVKIPAAWEYALPDGKYSVTVSVGDQPNGRGKYDSQHTINVESVTAIDDFQGSPIQEYKKATVLAEVGDGKLTIDAIGGTNTKINYIHIASALEPPQRPNVVVIMADDLSRGELGKAVDMGWMPNFKTYLLDQGTTFRQSFVSDSLCCPSRATFFTGQYPHNHGVLDVVLPKGGVTKFDDTSTLATWLKQAGYQTGLVGKYLNEYGKNLVAGDPSDDPTYIPPGWDDWQALVGTPSRLYNYVINDNGTVVDYGVDPATPPAEYQTDVLAQRSVRFINQSEASDDTTPFFLSINPSAPHLPATPAPRHQGTASTIPLPQPPSFNELDVSDKPAWLQAEPQLGSQRISDLQSQYRNKLESLRAVDDLVGKVVTALVQNKELKNTVLMFTSDNGYMFGDHRLTSKVRVYEESIRVPLYIRAPGISKQSTSRLVINNDLAPTIADFANATPDIPVDGRSLIPLLQEPNLANWRKRFLVESFVGSNSGRDYFAVRTSDTDTVTPKQVYVEYSAGDRELYDLAIDPYQLQSLHNDPARQQQIQILQNHLTNLKTSSGESSRIFEDA